jgi:hypothetical protein
MTIKKIGVLTYIKEYANIGTNMQSYSTLRAVQKAYPDARVELVDYSGWKPAMRPYLSSVSVKSLKNDFIRIIKYKKFFKEHLVLSKDKLISPNLALSIEFIKKQSYDAIFVGSDTLLELKRAEKNELTAYWLDNRIHSKKFLLAASALNVTYDSLSEKQKEAMQKTVDDFSLLGVRDEVTSRLISNFVKPGDERLKTIPDPTFTYDIDHSYVEQYIKSKKISFDKPIVCLHLLRDTQWASELAGYFRDTGYVVASLRPAHYADIIFTDMSPFEHVGMYKYFDLVITHRFHDSIFCFKNLTPVIVFPEFITDVTAFGESKNLTLFKSFNVEKTNFIENKNNVTAKHIFSIHKEAIASFKRNEDFIKNKLNENKKAYEAFLKESVKICEK